MLVAQYRWNGFAVLVCRTVLDRVHADRTAGQHSVWLLGDDGQAGKRAALMLTGGVVPDWISRAPFPGEHRVH
jgi:hypothetical protein